MYYKFVLIVSILFCSYQTVATTNRDNDAIKADQLLKESIDAKKTQNFELAISKLIKANQLQPNNSDILVQLGFNYYALTQLEQAKKSFESALDIAPNYVDAQYGLVSVVLAKDPNHPEKAKLLLDKYLNLTPNDEQLLSLQANIDNIKKNTHYWNIVLSGTHSRLSKSLPNWNEVDLALSYRLSQQNTITGHFTQANRFHSNDQKIGLTYWHTFNNKAYGYLSGSVATSKKFYATYTITSGGDYQLFSPYNDQINSFHITLDAKLDHYNDGNIKTISPGIEQFFFNDRLSIAGKWYNTFDQDNHHMSGYLFKTTISPTEELHLFAGYANSQETSDRSIKFNRSLIKVKSHFIGLSYDISNSITGFVNYNNEERVQTNHSRKLYTKKTLGCGIKWTF